MFLFVFFTREKPGVAEHCKGWKMGCEVILLRNGTRGEITKYYFSQNLSTNIIVHDYVMQRVIKAFH